MVASLVAEHQPQGPTEEHLVEELAGVLWRKRRLRLAEAAAHRRGLENTFSSYRDTAKAALAHIAKADESVDVSEAVHVTPADSQEELRHIDDDEAMTRRALDVLDSRSNDPYELALAALREDTQGWWADTLTLKPDELEEDEEPSTPDAEGLRRFLEGKVLPWFEERRAELARRPLLREQALANLSTRTSSNGSVATRSTWTASSSGCWPCCCASRTCGSASSRADPFRKKLGGNAGSVPAAEQGAAFRDCLS